MIENDSHYKYSSGTMMILAVMFLLFFSAGLSALVLLATGVLSGDMSVFLLAGIATGLAGLAAWNMEVGIEMRPEGLHFIRLLKPGHTVPYNSIQRVGIRMMRGWFYCFMRYGEGFLSGTFFPVGYWTRDNKEKTNAFLSRLADRANLVEINKTPLGAPIYEQRRSDT